MENLNAQGLVKIISTGASLIYVVTDNERRTEGIVAHIPFHRVRTVRKNGAVIWRRPSRVATR